MVPRTDAPRRRATGGATFAPSQVRLPRCKALIEKGKRLGGSSPPIATRFSSKNNVLHDQSLPSMRAFLCPSDGHEKSWGHSSVTLPSQPVGWPGEVHARLVPGSVPKTCGTESAPGVQMTPACRAQHSPELTDSARTRAITKAAYVATQSHDLPPCPKPLSALSAAARAA